MSTIASGGDAHRNSVDREIAARLCEAGRKSLEHQQYQTDLTELVVGTLTRLNREGGLFAEIRRQCGIGLPPTPQNYRRNAAQLIGFAAAVAVPKFIESYIFDGKWDPSKASLRSCCVRKGFYEFADQYKLFCAEQKSRYDLPGDDVLGLIPTQRRTSPVLPEADPEQQAVDRDTIRRLLATAGPEVTVMLLMTAEGYTQREIAETMGLSPDAISSAIRRYRSGLAKK